MDATGNGGRLRAAGARKLLPWLLMAVVIGLGWVTVRRTVSGSSDLRGFYKIWRANLVEPTLPVRLHGAVEQDPDPYPPTSYVLFAPLGALPVWGVGLFWYGLNLGCTWGVWRLTRSLLRLPPGHSRSLWWAALAVAPFWVGNLLRGQNAPLLMLLTLASFWLAERGRSFWSGSLIAVATLIKVIPAAFLLPYVVRRDSRALAGFAATLAVLVLGAASLFFGPRTNYDFHVRWWSYVTHQTDGPPDPLAPDTTRGSTRSNNQSLEAVLARLMLPIPVTPRRDTPQINIVTVEAATWRTLRTIGLVGFALLACVAAVGSRWMNRNRSDTGAYQAADDLALLCPLILIISPIVWSHYYCWMFFPLAYLLERRGELAGRGLPRSALFGLWLAAVPLFAWTLARTWGVSLWVTSLVFLGIAAPALRAAWRTACRRRDQDTAEIPEGFGTVLLTASGERT